MLEERIVVGCCIAIDLGCVTFDGELDCFVREIGMHVAPSQRFALQGMLQARVLNCGEALSPDILVRG